MNRSPQIELSVHLGTGLSSAVVDLDAGMKAAVATGRRVNDLETLIARLEDKVDPSRPTGTTPDPSALSTAESLLGVDAFSDLTNQLTALMDSVASGQGHKDFTEFSPFTCRLDGYDLLAMGLAGTVAAVVDLFVVRIPSDVRWGGARQSGSPVTGWLRAHSIQSDNWLARVAKVPFDEIAGHGEVIPGLSPGTHRAQTFGHDPLFGLVLGTLDIMRGTITGAGREGGVGAGDSNRPAGVGLVEALTLEIAHLLSDLPTKCGLPLPGWAPLMTVSNTVGGRPVSEIAREMYVRGYSTTHLPALATPHLALQMILKTYWSLRSGVDAEFQTEHENSMAITGTEAVDEQPRFRAMNVGAHGLATALNLGKLAAFGGNPLAANFSLWCSFFRSLYTYSDTALLNQGTTTDELFLQFERNSRRLAGMLNDDGQQLLADAKLAQDSRPTEDESKAALDHMERSAPW